MADRQGMIGLKLAVGVVTGFAAIVVLDLQPTPAGLALGVLVSTLLGGWLVRAHQTALGTGVTMAVLLGGRALRRPMGLGVALLSAALWTDSTFLAMGTWPVWLALAILPVLVAGCATALGCIVAQRAQGE